MRPLTVQSPIQFSRPHFPISIHLLNEKFQHKTTPTTECPNPHNTGNDHACIPPIFLLDLRRRRRRRPLPHCHQYRNNSRPSTQPRSPSQWSPLALQNLPYSLYPRYSGRNFFRGNRLLAVPLAIWVAASCVRVHPCGLSLSRILRHCSLEHRTSQSRMYVPFSNLASTPQTRIKYQPLTLS